MKLLYFAWIRQQVGISEEEVDLPTCVTSVSTLLDWLATRNAEFRNALKDRTVIRVAVNQQHAASDQSIEKNDEVALFPPVTGG